MGCFVISYFLDRKGRTPRTCSRHFPPSITASSSMDIRSLPSFWKFWPWDSCVPFVTLVLYISMVSFPSRVLQLFRVVSSFPPRNKLESQLPIMVSMLSLYSAFNWLCACSTRQAEISLDLIVAMSFSRFGICPMFAASSIRQRTCTGSRPPYLSSALSQSRLKSCV